jgi:hypothetical protein
MLRGWKRAAMYVKLTDIELAQCTVAGLQRLMRKLQGHNSGFYYNNSLSFQERVVEEAESVAAEWAVSKYYDLPFDPVKSNEHYKNKADVGNAIEVKWSKYHDGHLIVYEYDRISDIAVLVTGKSPAYVIKGWIPVAVAQKPRYRHTSQPTWWVSQNHLQPIETLKASSYANAIN